MRYDKGSNTALSFLSNSVRAFCHLQAALELMLAGFDQSHLFNRYCQASLPRKRCGSAAGLGRKR